jgi:hypothetical protein
MLKKIALLLLVCVAVGVSSEALAKQKRVCGWKKSCENNPDCQCFCARKGDYREKEENDTPVYVKNDPYKKYCYCNVWDRDAYRESMEDVAD